MLRTDCFKTCSTAARICCSQNNICPDHLVAICNVRCRNQAHQSVCHVPQRRNPKRPFVVHKVIYHVCCRHGLHRRLVYLVHPSPTPLLTRRLLLSPTSGTTLGLHRPQDFVLRGRAYRTCCSKNCLPKLKLQVVFTPPISN